MWCHHVVSLHLSVAALFTHPTPITRRGVCVPARVSRKLSHPHTSRLLPRRLLLNYFTKCFESCSCFVSASGHDGGGGKKLHMFRFVESSEKSNQTAQVSFVLITHWGAALDLHAYFSSKTYIKIWISWLCLAKWPPGGYGFIHMNVTRVH